MVIYRVDGKVTTIDHREPAPAAMTPTRSGRTACRCRSTTRATAAFRSACPGPCRAGRRRSSSTGQISLARRSRPRSTSRDTASHRPDVLRPDERQRDFFDDIPATAALFLDPDGTPRDVGTVFTNPDLAPDVRAHRAPRPKGFYRGAVADALVETVQHPPVGPTANHVWRPGVIKMRDLHEYVAPERAPTHVTYRGHDVYSMGPPSSGGSTVGEALNILEGYDLASMPRADALHYFLEASRYSFADRTRTSPTPTTSTFRSSGLLSKDYAATRRALIKTAARRAGGRPVPVQPPRLLPRRTATREHDPPHDERQVGQRRLVHVHDRVDRRRRPRRAGLGLPAEQRADRLQLRLDDPSEPRRGRQAAAQLDEPDDRAQGRASRSWRSARRAGR